MGELVLLWNEVGSRYMGELVLVWNEVGSR